MKDPLRDPGEWEAFREWVEWCAGGFLTPVTRFKAYGSPTLSLTEPPGHDTCQAQGCDNKRAEAEGVSSLWQRSMAPSETWMKKEGRGGGEIKSFIVHQTRMIELCCCLSGQANDLDHWTLMLFPWPLHSYEDILNVKKRICQTTIFSNTVHQAKWICETIYTNTDVGTIHPLCFLVFVLFTPQNMKKKQNKTNIPFNPLDQPPTICLVQNLICR